MEEQAKLKHDTEAFEQEKKSMATVAVAENDVLNLNVGGTLLATKRSTLTQVCNFHLSGLFDLEVVIHSCCQSNSCCVNKSLTLHCIWECTAFRGLHVMLLGSASFALHNCPVAKIVKPRWKSVIAHA